MHKQQTKFDRAVKDIRKSDPSYEPEAYEFLRDALEHTVNELRQDESIEHRHVCGPELLEGFRDYALKEHGAMAFAVLESWNVHRCEDVGRMVFQLIESGVFGQSETDRIEDFRSIYTFDEAFCEPFRPKLRSHKRDNGESAQLDSPKPRNSTPTQSSEQYEQPELS